MSMNKQKTILVVEDEKILRNLLVEVLSDQNFLALEAKNGNEGLEIALSKHPDLILLDLLLPGMRGMQVLKKIREDAWGASVPVIILTNLSATNEELVNGMVTYKPMYYLIKSDWKIEDVIKKIEEILESET